MRVYNSGACGSLLDDIDPDDIENIEIVRGAAARVRFGEEAAAGAIVITLVWVWLANEPEAREADSPS